MSYVRVPYHGPPITGASDRDNFVRNLLTVPDSIVPVVDVAPRTARPLSPSVADLPPILTLDEIKLHCRIESDQTVEDPLLTGYERAARIHTQNILRRVLDETCGENVRLAMLVLIAHWYRQREAVSPLRLAEVPLAYLALLWPERDLSDAYGAGADAEQP